MESCSDACFKFVTFCILQVKTCIIYKWELSAVQEQRERPRLDGGINTIRKINMTISSHPIHKVNPEASEACNSFTANKRMLMSLREIEWE